MRTLGLWLLAAAIAAAQTPPTAALVSGVLLERDAQPAGGEFSVRLATDQVFRYLFDRKTYVERQHNLIDVPGLRPGEEVEVVSDAVPGSVLRYARAIHVLDDPPPGPRAGPAILGRYRAGRAEEDRLIPTGNLTFSGVVFHIAPGHLVLHMRDGGEQSLNLRKDTRFLEDGEMVDAASLRPNMRVFVRAGKDLYDEIEAYQVIWGKILEPK